MWSFVGQRNRDLEARRGEGGESDGGHMHARGATHRLPPTLTSRKKLLLYITPTQDMGAWAEPCNFDEKKMQFFSLRAAGLLVLLVG